MAAVGLPFSQVDPGEGKENFPFEERKEEVNARVDEIWAKMTIGLGTLHHIDYMIESLDVNANISRDERGINRLLLTSFFLIRSEDLEHSTKGEWIRNMIARMSCDGKRWNLNTIFEQPQDLSNMQEFMLHHEIAHYVLGHVKKAPQNSEENRAREHQADCVGGAYGGDQAIEGGLSIFKIFSRNPFLVVEKDGTHPSPDERLSALQEKIGG